MEKIIKSSNYGDAKVVYCMVEVDDTNLVEGVDITPTDEEDWKPFTLVLGYDEVNEGNIDILIEIYGL